MALNWNIEKCKDYKKLSTNKEWPVTDVLIWGTMLVGLGDITEKNYKEFYARFDLIQKLQGAMLNKGKEPYFITAEDVKRRIGLHTNVSAMSRPAFIKLKVGRFFEDTVGKA